MFRRIPYAAARSKPRKRFASKKWQCDPTCTGRSPRLLTVIVRVCRPAFSSIGSDASRYSPGIIPRPGSAALQGCPAMSQAWRRTRKHLRSSDRLVDGHALGAVRERAFDLDLGDHFRDALHDGVRCEDRRADAHDLGDRFAVADQLEDFRGDESDRFRVIQLEAAGAALAREFAGGKNQQLVDFTRGEVHRTISGPALYQPSAASLQPQASAIGAA